MMYTKINHNYYRNTLKENGQTFINTFRDQLIFMAVAQAISEISDPNSIA